MTDIKNVYVAIMAGGVGSRFWPSSTDENPKQFLDILGSGKSLLQLTYERFIKLVPEDRIYIVTHKNYHEKILQHIQGMNPERIISEPSRNNTAPGIAYTAFKIHDFNPNAKLIMAPSDHIILKEDIFIEKLKKAIEFCDKSDSLVTLGILPHRPDTGYGYIKFKKEGNPDPEIKKVEAFKEKPNLQTAIKYLNDENYLWNSGMFIWKSKSILKAFKEYANEIHEILSKGTGLYNTEKEEDFIEEFFPKTPNISVDYAIMEQAENIYTIPSDIGWSDLGTWNALHSFLPKDKDENVILAKTKIVEDASNNMIKVDDKKTLVVKGLKNFIVIDEKDVLLIYPKNKEQEIKKIRDIAINL